MKKFLCTALLATTIILPITTLSASASSNYGSDVKRNVASTYGYAWTQSPDDICRARIVIMGQTSDITKPSYAQTNQVSGTSLNKAYINHYVNEGLIASYTK